MSSDALHRDCVASLWRLVEAARVGTDVDHSAQEAVVAVRAAMGSEAFLLLHERSGQLHVDGRALLPDADTFQAAQGLATAMRRRAIGETLFDPSVDADDLCAWATAFAAGSPSDDEHGRTVHTARRDPEAAAVARRRRNETDAADSRLRAVFLETQLLASLGDGFGPPTVVREALQAVVEALLAASGGMELLHLLQQDPPRLVRGLRAAAYAVVMGRLAGAADRVPAELGAAALSVRVGALVDLGDPQPAAAHWLLGLGPEPLWAQCARIALEIDAPEAGFAARLVRAAEAAAVGLPGDDVALAELRAAGERVLASQS